MRSQKQNNRSPRPFKNQTSDRWSGGKNQHGFIPPPKPPLRPSKPQVKKDEETTAGDAQDTPPP